MTKAELKQTLDSEGIPESMYDLDGGLRDDTLCLWFDTLWFVYYSERGKKSGEMIFGTESEACEYLLSELRKSYAFMKKHGAL